MAARGKENLPKKKHAARGAICEIVLYEQSKHRDASRANGEGYKTGGKKDWQSHHLLCISAMGQRKAKDDPTTILLEESLFLTEWNINEEPNMIGLPKKSLYMKVYHKVESLKPESARDAEFEKVVPQSIPAHDIDHNTDGGFTDEVRDYLYNEIWSKFASKGMDHKKDAEWLVDQLRDASKEFQRRLLEDRGMRKGGTVSAWNNRVNDKMWAAPFSMAKKPTQRYWGRGRGALGDIFKKL